jgi:hypothetical protein
MKTGASGGNGNESPAVSGALCEVRKVVSGAREGVVNF